MRRASTVPALVIHPGSRGFAAAGRVLGAILLGTVLLAGLPRAGAGEIPDSPDQGTVLIGEGHAWRFFRGTQDPPADWSQRGFDDSAWETGPTGIGYGDGDDRTVLQDMRCAIAEGGGEKENPCVEGGYLTFFARTGFEAPALEPGQRLFVKVSYDDGLVLYVNGAEVGRVNMPDGPITRETAALTAIGDAPASPDAVIVIPAERLEAGANVLAASVHNVRLSSSDASFVPRLIAGEPDEPKPEPGCEDRCAARASEAFKACLTEGLPEEECRARKSAVFKECTEAECDVVPPDEPTCEERCEEGAAKAFKLCREEGGSEEACRKRSLAALKECVAACDGKPPEKPCADECAASGNAVFLACLEAGGGKEDCRRRADGIVALCLERCGAGTPCEDRCAVAAQIVLTGCALAELPEEDCRAMANSVLERCVGGCEPPPSCEGGCEELAARAVEECKAREGSEEECAAAGVAVREDCLAHCGGEPVPGCDAQCEGKAAEILERCVAGGKPEAECKQERDAFLTRCREELGEVCKKELAALESAFQLFERGDSNRDGGVDLSDAVAVLGFLFLGTDAPPCEDAADANDDGQINITDPILILSSLFMGSGPLPEPSGEKGQDPTADRLLCSS
ncbi:MAG: hypothetical protein HY721_06830 [Planctomycetes bacterium]|nr:hypothetical protein [Planctomycetota bacterium]